MVDIISRANQDIVSNFSCTCKEDKNNLFPTDWNQKKLLSLHSSKKGDDEETQTDVTKSSYTNVSWNDILSRQKCFVKGESAGKKSVSETCIKLAVDATFLYDLGLWLRQHTRTSSYGYKCVVWAISSG